MSPPSPDAAAAPLPSRLRVDTEAAGLRADAFLSRELPFLSRRRIRQKIQMGESLLNGRRYSTATRLRSGDDILVTWRGCPHRDPVAALDVLYEDEQLLAVDKPAGVASHPMGGVQAGTVVQFARQRDAAAIRERLSRGDMDFYPTLVNRLDRLTSGIVLIARTRAAHAAMQDLMKRRLVSKEYLAIVEGEIHDEAGSIEMPIGADAGSRVRVKMACRADGRPSLTRYAVVRVLRGHTLLRAFALTGRQHQVRVHFAAIGHPVWGDLLYKDESLFLRYQKREGEPDPLLPPRHCLHAARLSFRHPFSGKEIAIEAPLPADFLSILEDLRPS